jgi:hypothetical protein
MLEQTKEITPPQNLAHFMNKQSSLERDLVFQPKPPSNVYIHVAIVNAQLSISVLSLQLCNTRPQSHQTASSLAGTS